MTRDQLIEAMARALAEHDGRDPDAAATWFGGNKIWVEYESDAKAALTAIEAAGMRVVPRDDAVNVVASLAAAISIIERTPQARKAAMSDTAFGIMLDDYTKALATGRAMLAAQEDSTSE